ncbi:hypothetical protein Hanom_Chr00s000114g01622551 [Helianthus anomalus]
MHLCFYLLVELLWHRTQDNDVDSFRDSSSDILDLVSRFTELKSMKSCDLFSSSWLSVAWYPIYRNPMGSTLKDFNAVFYLSFSSYTNHRFVIFCITFVLYFEPVDLITET